MTSQQKHGTDGYTFENGVLTVTEDVTEFGFSCRPQGDNCKWQNYTLFATQPMKSKNITTSNVVGGKAIIKKDIKDGNINSAAGTGSIVIPSSTAIYGYAGGVNKDVPANQIDKLEFVVKAGTAASLSYTSTDNYAATQVRGKTTITNDTITVTADAKSTDSVNTQYIQVIVEE